MLARCHPLWGKVAFYLGEVKGSQPSWGQGCPVAHLDLWWGFLCPHLVGTSPDLASDS